MGVSGKTFRKGAARKDISPLFPDDAEAEKWFEELRWGQAGNPAYCPICGRDDKLRAVPSRRPLPYRCGSCRRYFSVRVGSVMHRSPIPLDKWAIAICLWAASPNGVSSVRLHRELGITQKSAYFLARRLREASEAPVGPGHLPVGDRREFEVRRRLTGHRPMREGRRPQLLRTA